MDNTKLVSTKEAMNEIGDFIINNDTVNVNQELRFSVMQCGVDMEMSLNDMCDELFEKVDIEMVSRLVLSPDNVGCQRKIIISFIYNGRKCDIGELLGSQRDYFWVTIHPI